MKIALTAHKGVTKASDTDMLVLVMISSTFVACQLPLATLDALCWIMSVVFHDFVIYKSQPTNHEDI